MDPRIILLAAAVAAGAYGARKTSTAVYRHAAKPAYHFVLHPVASLTGKAAKSAGKAAKAAAKHQLAK